MRDAAFQAMQFAHKAHAGQRRKYTGDVRRAPKELVDAMSSLYVVGVQVSRISEMTGISSIAIRNYVANHDLKRDESQFAFGAACVAEDGESFKVVPWAPWYYVSDLGRLLGMSPSRPGIFIKPSVSSRGYLFAKLVELDGAPRNNYIHRIVLRVFDREPGELEECAHWDGDPSNNRLSNLRWATHAENDADKDRHGTRPIGSRHANAKIDESVAVVIKARLSSGQRQSSVARELCIPASCVANIAQGKTWLRAKEAA